MKITITITTNNAAFEADPCTEIARILNGWIEDMQIHGVQDRKALRDVNGNTVGAVKVTGR